MLTSSALVFLMIPGIALVYSGAADRNSAITMARMPLITTAFVGVQVRTPTFVLDFYKHIIIYAQRSGTFGDTRSHFLHLHASMIMRRSHGWEGIQVPVPSGM